VALAQVNVLCVIMLSRSIVAYFTSTPSATTPKLFHAYRSRLIWHGLLKHKLAGSRDAARPRRRHEYPFRGGSFISPKTTLTENPNPTQPSQWVGLLASLSPGIKGTERQTDS
jgi:hypothetical protein